MRLVIGFVNEFVFIVILFLIELFNWYYLNYVDDVLNFDIMVLVNLIWFFVDIGLLY